MTDTTTRTVSHRGASIQLTPREYQLFQALLEHPGQLMTARQLVLRAWRDTTLADEELRTYLTSLRRKLRQIELGRVVNRRGRGYTLVFGT